MAFPVALICFPFGKRLKAFQGSSASPIHSKNEVLRWARFTKTFRLVFRVIFCAGFRSVTTVKFQPSEPADFHPEFLRLATVSKLKIRTAEICPLFFSTNFQVLPLGQKLVFSETGQMSAKMQSYPQKKNTPLLLVLLVLIVQGAQTPYFYGLKKL